MSEKFLIFDIWGDYAHFKKYYTTSSPLTFSIPPRTAIIGLISAIIGKGKEEYLNLMTKDKAEIAVRIINPIKKIRMTQNLINTKGGYWTLVKNRSHSAPRSPIRFEYLKAPRFRIYFRHTNDEIYSQLKMNLENHKSVYTPCLGISELIANFGFCCESAVSKKIDSKEFNVIKTVIPLDKVVELDLQVNPDLQESLHYFKERIPVEMLPGRIVTEYREVLYEIKGRGIRARVNDAIKLENADVITIL